MLWTLIFKSENNKNYNGLIQSEKKNIPVKFPCQEIQMK